MPENLPLPNRFNLRTYGICIRNGHVLLVREILNGFTFTKFPGGGLEFGEGLEFGLMQEIKEELHLDSKIIRHFYTTDFFQRSAFNANEQLISVYYLIDIFKLPAMESFPIVINSGPNHELLFYWFPLETLTGEEVTFPIDKLVANKLCYTKAPQVSID